MPAIDFLVNSSRVGIEPAFFSSQIEAARRFTVDLNPPRTASLAVVCGGNERCAADYRVDRTTFPYYSVEFVAAGRGTLRLNGAGHQLGAGDVFVYGPGVSHVITSHPTEHLVKYFVDFTGKRASQLLRENGLVPGSIVQTSAADAIMRLFDELIATGQRRSPRGSSLCALLVEQILLRTFETLIPAKSLGSKAFATFTACRRYITEHHLKATDIRDIAAACGVDVSYMCRLFQRFDRQSPYQILTKERMVAAARMLDGEGVLVKQVAKRMGYSDPFHFSRAFRRTYGISPQQFQRLYDRRDRVA